MPIRPHTLLVFIGSPGDVSAERKAAVSAIAKVSENVAKGQGWRIEPVTWERDVLPSYGKDPQKIINDRLNDLRGMDLCVFVMRDKFGTPTPRAGSGTEEEYGLAVEARKRRKSPEIWVCFGAQTSGLRGARAIQQSKAKAFRDRVSKRHIRMEFGTTAHFRKDFETFLSKWVSERLANEKSKSNVSGGKAGDANLTAKNAMLLGQNVYRVLRREEERGSHAVTLAVRSVAEERALRALGEGYRPVSYAFGLLGGSVRISQVKFGEEKGREVAFVRFDAPQVGGGTGFAYGGDEAARDATLRRVLLGEEGTPKPNAYGLGTREESLKAVIPAILSKSNEPSARLEARLRAVQVIFEAGLVSEIEQLTIGARTSQGDKVTFTAKARSAWNGELKPLRVVGLIGPRKSRRKTTS